MDRQKYIEFAESKGASSGDSYSAPSRPEPRNVDADGFMNIPQDLDDDLPFN